MSYRPNSPFLDERVRQAVSMLIDRGLFMETFYNTDQFKAEGIPAIAKWNTFLHPAEGKYWLDPEGNELGASGKYFKYDPAEAKKLIRAAGHNGAIKTRYTYTHNGYGANYAKQAEVLRSMLSEHGDFDFDVHTVDYASEFRYGYTWSHGDDIDGIAPTPFRNSPNLDLHLFTSYHSQGAIRKTPFKDQTIDDLDMKQRKETDVEKRMQAVHDLQRYQASKMYSVPWNGAASQFELVQPWYGNYGFYRSYAGGSQQESLLNLWYDSSKGKPA
jgi:ABC-type transport system substrate-binding protein